jgi:hypothetical protein
MSATDRYLLDANVFIQAHQSYYGFDICPGFWLALSRHHERHEVFSIAQVRKELLDHQDRLSEWAEELPVAFFKKTDDVAVIAKYQAMAGWVQSHKQFTEDAKGDFLTAADGWLAAYASVNQVTLVTHEQFAPDAKIRVPPPNLCDQFNAKYCNTFEMLRALKTKLVLKKRR